MSDNFAFLLPVMMATFGCAFLMVWRFGARPALFWGLGYFLSGLAFAAPLALRPDAAKGIVSGLFFVTAFLCFRQALLLRFRRPPSWALGLGICGAAVAANAFAFLAFGSLRLEIVFRDLTCAILLASALLSIRRLVRQQIDKGLYWLTALVVLDHVLRGVFAATTRATDFGPYLDSSYAVLTHATTAALSALVFGLTALAALFLDVIAQYRTEALSDPLTGLWNRRGFEAAVPDLAKATPPRASVLTCDIDHFKRVNDTLGHAVGDRVIATVAQLLKSGLPPGAVLSRFGGEEFIVYLPTPDGIAHLLADQLRRAIADHAWAAVGVTWPLTASFGLTEVGAHDASLDEAILRADRALYEAKRAGRNTVATRPLAA